LSTPYIPKIPKNGVFSESVKKVSPKRGSTPTAHFWLKWENQPAIETGSVGRAYRQAYTVEPSALRFRIKKSGPLRAGLSV
jgi:hypothetical protein